MGEGQQSMTDKQCYDHLRAVIAEIDAIIARYRETIG